MVQRVGRVAAVVVVLGVVSACGGSGSGSASGADDRGGGPEQQVDVIWRETDGFAAGFDVAAGEGTGWLLVDGEPAQVWEIGSDGTLTGRAELDDGGDEIAPFAEGAAVARFRCTDPTDSECGAPVAELVLIGPDGSVDHELTLAESGAGGLEGVGMHILGTSDEQVWLETRLETIDLFAVSRSGDVETVPAARDRPFANDQACVVGGELLSVRVHTDLYDPEQGPPATGVAVGPETPIRTTVGFEAFVDGEWRPVAGSERSFDLRGDEARADCESGAVQVEGSDVGAESENLARWTHDEGWVDAPAVTAAFPPLGSVGVEGCEECVWGPDGEILRPGDDGRFRATGVVVADPDGADAPPEATQVDLGHDGSLAACAGFPRATDPNAPNAPPSTVTATPSGADAQGLRAPREEGRPLVCDLAPG